MKVIWRPQAKQEIFMRRKEYEVLYGGAAGGGKSEAIVMEALRQVHIPYYKALILRKTFPQLSELIDKSLKYYPQAVKGARYNDSKHRWVFPSGAKIMFGSMQFSKDKVKYQGQAYDFIAFDELTHFTFDEYNYLFSRNRPNGAGTRCYIRATANPGGVGHGWVKERFITAAPALTPVKTETEVRLPDGSIQKTVQERIFIPSTVFDNEALMKNDPLYISRLALMPEAEKKALLYGDWDSFTGQVFTEWRNDPEHYSDRRGTHVIEPFRIPDEWRIYRGFDFGFARPFSVGWYAVDFDKRIYRIREYYGCTGTPNDGIRLEPAEIAREIRRIESEDENLKGKKITGIADPSIYDESRGESVARMMERERVYFERGDNERIPGKMQVHHRMRFDERGIPLLYVFKTCRHFIRTVPALVYSERDVEDVDTAGEDHIYDELRYVCMANPITPPQRKQKERYEYNPLDTEDYGNYEWFLKY